MDKVANRILPPPKKKEPKPEPHEGNKSNIVTGKLVPLRFGIRAIAHTKSDKGSAPAAK